MTASTNPVTEEVSQVLIAANALWRALGDTAETDTFDIGLNQAHRFISPRYRRVEVLVDAVTDDVREVLTQRPLADGWTFVLLVPLALIGQAHETMYATGWLGQPWWIKDGLVRFGTDEVL